MRINFIIGIIILFPFLGFSQGEWNNWYFGVHEGMNFKSGSPVALPASAFTQSAGLTTISVSDSAGTFLFYSNGGKVPGRGPIVIESELLLDQRGKEIMPLVLIPLK